MTYKEKRGYPRFPGILQVEYGKDAVNFSTSKTLNVSLSGLFIKTEYPLEKGERILTSIFIPGANDSILVECQVVWNRMRKNAIGPPGMGVRIVDISEEDRNLLTSFCQADE